MTEDQVDSEIRAIIRAAITAVGDEWRTAVLSYCSSFDRNLADGDSRMLRENFASLRFYAQHGRAPDLSELRNAMEASLMEHHCERCSRAPRYCSCGTALARPLPKAPDVTEKEKGE
jgi:hypothetical protein